MASSASNTVSQRYVMALIDLAEQKKKIEAVEKDLLDLQSMLTESKDLVAFITNPVISKNKKSTAILDIAKKAKLDKITSNFLGVLADNNRLYALEDMILAFQAAMRKKRGEVVAKVETAFALTDKQTQALQDQISKSIGSDVTVDVSVNKDLLGGMIVTVGSKMIDDSVRRKLERLERQMASGSDKIKSVA